ATIITDVPIKESFDDFKLEEPDEETLKSLFEIWEFRTLTKRLFGDSAATTQPAVAPVFEKLKTLNDVPHKYHLIHSEKSLDSLIEELIAVNTFCFDVETNSLDRFSSKLLGIAFSHSPGEAFYLPITEWPSLREKLLPVFQSAALKIGHNLKFDLAIMLSHGIQVSGPFFDTMLAHTLAAPEQKHSMDSLSENLLGYSPIKLVDLFSGEQNEEDDLFAAAAKKKASKGELDPSELPITILAEYAAEDADVTLQLYHKLLPKLKTLDALPVIEDIESPLLPVLVAMENEGISMDQTVLDEVGKVLTIKIKNLSKEIEESAGRPFNLNSPKQLGEILFGEMKLVEKPKKTKTGQFKTDEQTLASLASKHSIVANILSYREASKLKSTYVDALPNHRAEHSGRVHTHLHQLVTSTGRLASSDPNLQNIPVRSEMGRELRRAFIPRNLDFTLMAADYSQVELRVMAALSGDPAMIKAFKNDLDIHTATAARVFAVETDEVVPEMRRTAKMVNFGIPYGISAFGLAQRLGTVSRTEAQAIIDNYFQQFPTIQNYINDQVEKARKDGYVTTLMGRRRYLRDINSSNGSIRAASERNAINMPIQGTAADLIKIAMIRISTKMKEANLQSKLLLQVHDELIFDLHPDEESSLKEILETEM
ncbi:MAG: DNA polymerase, partial [Akkermansiaceae bacterium]